MAGLLVPDADCKLQIEDRPLPGELLASQGEGVGPGLKTRYSVTNCIFTGVFARFVRYKGRYKAKRRALQR